MEKNDEYISFAETSYGNPYSNLALLKAEDILGYMLSYKRPFTEGDKGYHLRIKKKLHKEVCEKCFRYPDNHDSRPQIIKKVLDIEASKESRTAVTEAKYVTDTQLTCRGCRVLECKRSINREIGKPSELDIALKRMLGSIPQQFRLSKRGG